MADFPEFDKLWDAYPRGSADEVKAKIGGGVAGDWVVNTCTIRISDAFNQAGHAIPKKQKLPGDTFLATTYGGDKKRYAFRVREFRKYLEAEFGAPTLVHQNDGDGGPVPDDFSGKRGVICFEVDIWNDATGHLDLWNGKDCAGHAYFEQAREVALWVIDENGEKKEPFDPSKVHASVSPWLADLIAWAHTPAANPP